MARKAPKETVVVKPDLVRIARATPPKVAAASVPKRPRVGSVISTGNTATIVAPPPKASPKIAAKPIAKPAAKVAAKPAAMTRVRKITVKPIEEEETGEPQPIKIRVEGVDDDKPARRVKRAPRPPEPDDEDAQPAKPAKPISRVAAMVARTEVKPPISDDSEGFVGARFVRMLNRDNRVVGVTAGFIGERMMEGYRFIEGEPTIPTRTGPDDRVPNMKKIRPRDYPRPENLFNALEIWRASMLDDMDNAEGLIEPHRMVGRECRALIQRLTSYIENPALVGHVYGEPPTANIAKSLGFGG